MKFDCGPTWAEKRDAEKQWHKWFAWCPVRIGSHDCRWLEVLERRDKGQYRGSVRWWEYRAIK